MKINVYVRVTYIKNQQNFIKKRQWFLQDQFPAAPKLKHLFLIYFWWIVEKKISFVFDELMSIFSYRLYQIFSECPLPIQN